jgi:hypothetical protein
MFRSGMDGPGRIAGIGGRIRAAQTCCRENHRWDCFSIAASALSQHKYISHPAARTLTLVWTDPFDMLPFRLSLQWKHWVVGLPFFLTSNRGRSVWVHPEVRCPLIHVAQANFFSLIRTMMMETGMIGGSGLDRRKAVYRVARVEACKGRGGETVELCSQFLV